MIRYYQQRNILPRRKLLSLLSLLFPLKTFDYSSRYGQNWISHCPFVATVNSNYFFLHQWLGGIVGVFFRKYKLIPLHASSRFFCIWYTILPYTNCPLVTTYKTNQVSDFGGMRSILTAIPNGMALESPCLGNRWNSLDAMVNRSEYGRHGGVGRFISWEK